MKVWLYWLVGLSIATIAGAWLVKKYRNTFGYPALVALYATYIVVCNLLSSRLVVYDVLGHVVVTAGATFMFPFVAQIVDMINEVYGRRATYMAIAITLVASIVASIMVWHVAEEAPALDAMGVPQIYEEAWRYFMVPVPRIVFASYLAFFVAETIDAKVFADLKRYFYTKYREAYRDLKAITMFVLVRSVASDLANMVADSAIFFPVAFAFTIPWEALPDVLLGGTLVKVLVVVITQPFFIAYRVLIRDVERTID
ncbi:MAG: queuosine precursor transporter [Desulfurococcaceae archaeon]